MHLSNKDTSLDVLVLRNRLPPDNFKSNLESWFRIRSSFWWTVEDIFDKDFVVTYDKEHTAVIFSCFGRFSRKFFSKTDECSWDMPSVPICVSSLYYEPRFDIRDYWRSDLIGYRRHDFDVIPVRTNQYWTAWRDKVKMVDKLRKILKFKIGKFYSETFYRSQQQN